MKIKVRQGIALIAIIAAIFVLVHIIGIARRHAQYRAIQKTYTDALKPGMKRSEVEKYFIMSRYVSFNRGAEADVVEIGREKAGWICQEQVVYLYFEFAASEPNDKRIADSDRLVRISLFRSVCLDLP
jgi:hypothetical protein